MQVIVYATAGGCALVSPAPGLDIAVVAERSVPSGAASIIVDSATLPTAPKSQWQIVNGAIVVTPIPVPVLATKLAAAAAIACAALTSQIVPDATHQNAYVNAYNTVGPSATVPTVDPTKTTFAAMAASFGQQPQAFATLVVAIAAASMTLSSILATIEGVCAAPATTAPKQLSDALTAFETALATLVASITSSGIAVTAPAAITIVGINA